jgi:large subunit ribosomal protein L5
MINLVQKYKKIVEEAMMKQFKYKSIMQVPRIEKICINYGCGDATKDSKLIELAANEIKAITGQKPVFTKAKNSIAAFKLREGQKIGVKVTLQKEKM